MQNQEELPVDAKFESMTSGKASEVDDWENIKDNDIMQQQSAIRAEEAGKFPFVGDKARDSYLDHHVYFFHYTSKNVLVIY